MNMKSLLLLFNIVFLSIIPTTYADSATKLKGTIRIDGSSTVFPITEAVAEEYGKVQPRVRTTVGVSGTGGGFKKFTSGEIDINDASRAIVASEVALAKKNKVEYVELPIAYDGISVVTNKANTWIDHITVAELKKIWQPGSKVKTWKDVRSTWPDRTIRLYGPGTDSGTFDYFTKAINGKSHVSRSNYTKSEDDNVIVQGVSGDKDSLGYFGFAYYISNKTKLKAIPIKVGKNKAVLPTAVTINNGSYKPLSRPIFIYVSKASLKKPRVMSFVTFYIQKAGELAKETGYVALPKEKYAANLKAIGSNAK